MYIDLQLHSNYSDGYLRPTDLVSFIAKQGVKVASLTDHNTVGGIDEFRRACIKHGVKPIVGLELFVQKNNHRFNLLWYNFDETDPELHELLRSSHVRRRRQMRLILEKLQKFGFVFNINNILDKYSRYVPINHMIDEIKASKSNFSRIQKDLGLKNPREEDIIRAYFHSKRFGHLTNSYINIDRVLKLREKIGGQLILCHPAKFSYIKLPFMEKLKEMGIDGVETLSPHHSIGAVMYIQHIARQYDFIETGGSDFHRFEGDNHPIQHSWEYYRIDTEYLRGVKKIIG